MSFEIKAKLICDGCGNTHSSKVMHGASKAQFATRAVWFHASEDGWKEIDRGRGHTRTHYCPKCLDKPMKSVSRKTAANKGA